MTLRASLPVPKAQFDRMVRSCEDPQPALRRDDIIFDHDVTFPDGRWMAIQVCTSGNPSQESCWTQGVLFSREGHELNSTDAMDVFGGTYSVPFQGTRYEVEVIRMDRSPRSRARRSPSAPQPAAA